MASRALMMISGRINRPSVRPAESTVRPLDVVGSTTPSSLPLVSSSITRTNTARPNMP